MRMIAKRFALLSAALLLLTALASPSSAAISLTSVSWSTVQDNVEFSLRFHNDDFTNSSSAADVTLSAQPFGMFVESLSPPVGTFQVPSLAPDSFFDIIYTVALADLPPSPEIITPPGGGASTKAPPAACQTDRSWAGNVDVFWTGADGTGQSFWHAGVIETCPQGGNSYIHVVMDCQDPAGVSWSFSGLCPGWSASLVVNAGGIPGGAAPNPIPAGVFDGWICVSADGTVNDGDICNFNLDASCGALPATIAMTGLACVCGAVPGDETSWGRVKSRY